MSSSILQRNNVRVLGQGTQPIVFAHGFGCDQSMWSALAGALAAEYRLVLFDHVGCGGSEYAAFDPERHADLHGFAQDLVDLCLALDVRDAVLVGHAVGASIGVLAARQVPQLFSKLVLVAPSPRYLNEPPAYVGGFEREDIAGLLELMDSNWTAWARSLASAAMDLQRPDLAQPLAQAPCAMDPEAVRTFVEATFFADHRADFAAVRQPTLILQGSDDPIAPDSVGRSVHRLIRGSTLVRLRASGHCPHVSQPQETLAAIRGWLQTQAAAGD